MKRLLLVALAVVAVTALTPGLSAAQNPPPPPPATASAPPTPTPAPVPTLPAVAGSDEKPPGGDSLIPDAGADEFPTGNYDVGYDEGAWNSFGRKALGFFTGLGWTI